MKVVKIVLVVIQVIFSQVDLIACICMPSPDNLNYIRSSVVQTSGIHSIEYTMDYWKVTVSTNNNISHKGELLKEFYIDSDIQNSSCRININETSVWVLFLYLDSNTGRHYLSPCSGSRTYGGGDVNIAFDSTLIYDTTVYRFGMHDYFSVMTSKFDTTNLIRYIDTCTSIVNFAEKTVVVLLIKRNGEIQCADKQLKNIEPEVLRQINSYFKGKKIHPVNWNGVNINVEIVVTFKKLPPTPR